MTAGVLQPDVWKDICDLNIFVWHDDVTQTKKQCIDILSEPPTEIQNIDFFRYMGVLGSWEWLMISPNFMSECLELTQRVVIVTLFLVRSCDTILSVTSSIFLSCASCSNFQCSEQTHCDEAFFVSSNLCRSFVTFVESYNDASRRDGHVSEKMSIFAIGDHLCWYSISTTVIYTISLTTSTESLVGNSDGFGDDLLKVWWKIHT